MQGKNSKHTLVNQSQAIYTVLIFLDQSQLIELQQVCKRFYAKIVPLAMQSQGGFMEDYHNLPIFFEEKNILYYVKHQLSDENIRTSEWKKLGKMRNMPDNDTVTLILTPQNRLFMMGEQEFLNVAQRASMLQERYCFGSCTAYRGRYIVAVGGALSAFTQTGACEIYDAVKDKWYPLPTQNEAKFSVMLVNVKNKFLYSFCGTSKTQNMNHNRPNSTIEKLNIEVCFQLQSQLDFENYQKIIETKKWEILNIDQKDEIQPMIISQGFGYYDRLNQEILIYGGTKIKYDTTLVFDTLTEKFKKQVIWKETPKDRFFYNNYSVINKGRSVILLGRQHIHEINLDDFMQTRSIGYGYIELLEQN
ncbi:kelch motif family protein [Stylonychia lemnae]|uniref:Kelch motif family protein n=1 Tax=Stylonychia lemnae TaxID=5949 RepID=A0A077ZUB1_STYLE|nr:kelch motif family protein [Stylonychia lemnae]|eukprot:CDW73493.1 kelch motif family protein [Stylonychia lemnae]